MKKIKILNPLNDAIFIDKIDLHGDTVDIANYEVYKILRANAGKVGYKIVIIHGVGTGSLKEEVWRILRKNRHLIKFYLANNGTTVIEFISSDNLKIK